LDIGGTQQLFGGEKGILSLMDKLIASFAVEGRLVLTDRPEWAKAFAFQKQSILPAGKSYSRLLLLPIERLEVCGDPAALEEEFRERNHLVRFMKRVGMRLISDFAMLGPTAIGRRFGSLGMEIHQWVAGTKELCLPPVVFSEPVKETIDTEEIPSLENLLFYLRQSLVRIESRLRGRGTLAKTLKLTFELETGHRITSPLPLSQPMAEASSLLRLLKEHLGKTTWEAPLQSLEIEVSDTVPFTPGQLSLWDKMENQFADLARFVGRLRARFGEKAVGFADLQESYLPECSWKNVWPPPADRSYPSFPQRPPFLFSPPKPYVLRKHWKLIPSESLAAEWWENTGERHYFIAASPQGERLWIFWDEKNQRWFLHGTFD
jgi:protein ImuB